MLANSRNFVMEKPTLIDYSINTVLNTGSPGLDKLRQHICVDAAHDSNVNHVSKPACSPVTRKRILQDLADWMNDPNPAHKMMWLHGPAGAGKSAIAQSTMQRAVDDGHLAASFFFSRGAPGRSNADHLFSTIAYQMALNIPELERPVEAIVRRHPELPSKSFEIQFRELINRPARENNILGYPVIGIDGVDECDDDGVQTEFLTIIANAVISGQCPFRFLISSRHESHLIRLFNRIFDAHTQKIMLETSEEALDDVEAYLQTEFAKICELCSPFMQHVSQPWPLEDDILELRKRSSGHFIYAATVIRFVGGNKYQHPVDQLDIILRPSPETDLTLKVSPYSELDRLYLQVLSTHPDPTQLLEILKFVVTYSIYIQPGITLDLLDDLLGARPGTTETSLSGLHSLVKISTEGWLFTKFKARSSISFHHASFEEFLLNSSRSQHFHIDHKASLVQVQKVYAELLIQWLVEADQDIGHSVSKLYAPVWTNTNLGGYWHSARQENFACLCDCLKTYIYDPDMTSYMLRIIQCIPSKPGTPPNHMWAILQCLADMFEKWIENQLASIRLSYQTLMPLYRLHEAFESYLMNDNSQNLHLLLNLSGMFSHSIEGYLPLSVFSTLYSIKGSDLFTLVHESFPFLDCLHRDSQFYIRISLFLTRFLRKTPQYLNKFNKTIIGKCLDYLLDIDLITDDGHLVHHPETHNQALLVWLLGLGRISIYSWIFSPTPNPEVLWGPSGRPEPAIIEVIKRQYSQLLSLQNPLTKEPTSNIRINIGLLSLTPLEFLGPFLGFNASISSSAGLMGGIYIPKTVLRWELNILFDVCEARKEKLVLIMHMSTDIKENKRLLKQLQLSSKIYKLRETILPTSEKLRGVYRARSVNYTHPLPLRHPFRLTK